MLIYWYRQFNRISIIWKKWLYKSDLLVNAWIGNIKEMVLGSDEIKTKNLLVKVYILNI